MSAPCQATPPELWPGGPSCGPPGSPSPPGHLPVPTIPPEENNIEGPVPHPPGGPRVNPPPDYKQAKKYKQACLLIFVRSRT